MLNHPDVWNLLLWGLAFAACGGALFYDGAASIVGGIKFSEEENRMPLVSIFLYGILGAFGLFVLMTGVLVFVLAVMELFKT